MVMFFAVVKFLALEFSWFSALLPIARMSAFSAKSLSFSCTRHRGINIKGLYSLARNEYSFEFIPPLKSKAFCLQY